MLKVFGVFAVVVLMIRKKVPLGVSLVSGGVTTAFLFGMGPAETILESIEIGSQPETGNFVLLVSLVLAISIILEKSGQVSRLTDSLKGFVANRKLASATLPAIIGLLPMPGGALFSAPMVEATSTEMDIDSHKKAEINHWFRHVWEYSWPLYPGVIYTAGLLKLDVKEFSILQIPMTIVAIAAGFTLVTRGVKKPASAEATECRSRRRAAARFAFDLAPFLVIIALYLIIGISLLWSLLTALALSIAFNVSRKTITAQQIIRGIFTSTHYLNFVIMAYGVKLFSGMLDESGAINEMTTFFAESNFPTLALCVALPFIVGFVAGITIVFCTATFPLIIAMPGVSADPVPYIILSYASGFMGTMLSPLHACLALSSEYFKARLGKVILGLIPAAIIVLATGFALWLLYRHWLPF